MKQVTVIGLDGSRLSEEAQAALEAAVLVAGGERHLKLLAVPPERSVVLRGDLSEALHKIEVSEGPAAVLASGDPGFFGIVRLLAQRFGPGTLRVLPGVSSVSLAFARIGLPWDDALIVSAHGRDPRRAVNACRAYHKVAVLTSPDFGPAQLAQELEGLGRTFAVAERLGMPEERVTKGDAALLAGSKWEDPNVVLVLDEERDIAQKGWVSPRVNIVEGWALPEEEFEHRSSMITKPEIRALVLARLAPRTGDLIWDVGAGSGSVGIECARFGAAVISIERDPESCARIRKNALRHNIYAHVVEGEAPEALDGLPQPDAVFIGGSGGGFEETIKLCAISALRSVVLSLITLERVVPASELLEDYGYSVKTAFLQASRVKSTGSLHRLAAETPVFIVAGTRYGDRP